MLKNHQNMQNYHQTPVHCIQSEIQYSHQTSESGLETTFPSSTVGSDLIRDLELCNEL